ncbi:MAG TPA: hypothetical protein VN962_09460 [Polyangia bacterium]|nr:hypothetical protein [Polyangia bacterium]
MRIELRKISDAEHDLTVVRPDGARETVRCETRSTLVHDLLHYAAEREAGVATGFWGTLASGRTLADMNDRTGVALGGAGPDVMAIERIVGPLTAAVKGAAPDALASRLADYLAETGDAAPAWLTPAFVAAVQERMRRLLGAWRAVGHGETLSLDW